MRRLKRFVISVEDFKSIFAGGYNPAYLIADGLPDDAKILYAEALDANTLGFLVESESYPYVNPNVFIPVIEIPLIPAKGSE